MPAALEMLQQSFKQAMRGFAGAVSVVTVADPLDERERSGFTATSVSSFSTTPPMVVASMKATSSSAELMQRTRRFGVNLLREEQQAIAQRFTGFGGEAASSATAAMPGRNCSPTARRCWPMRWRRWTAKWTSCWSVTATT